MDMFSPIGAKMVWAVTNFWLLLFSVANLTEVRTAIDLFGGVYIGPNLPFRRKRRKYG